MPEPERWRRGAARERHVPSGRPSRRSCSGHTGTGPRATCCCWSSASSACGPVPPTFHGHLRPVQARRIQPLRDHPPEQPVGDDRRSIHHPGLLRRGPTGRPARATRRPRRPVLPHDHRHHRHLRHRPTKLHSIALTFLFLPVLGLGGASFAVFTIWLPEQYPTRVRATAFALTTTLSRWVAAAAPSSSAIRHPRLRLARPATVSDRDRVPRRNRGGRARPRNARSDTARLRKLRQDDQGRLGCQPPAGKCSDTQNQRWW